MNKYIQKDINNNQIHDITSQFSNQPTLPGPIIIVTDGDKVKITLVNEVI